MSSGIVELLGDVSDFKVIGLLLSTGYLQMPNIWYQKVVNPILWLMFLNIVDIVLCD